jgi:F-type H+-transporting ATPase subunit a
MFLKKTLWVFGGFFPLCIIIVITGLEIVIAMLQAYVFTILVCIYINDIRHLH